jgi:myo-inositol 2-dehydrogenase / D-chiro-inositol 1-dehydrogenase
MNASNPSRRKFLATTGIAAAGMTIIKPELVRGTAANSKIKLGLIGCGGRGSWIAKLFRDNGNYEITAAADYFQDKVDRFGEQLGIPEKQRFTGLSGYKRLIDSGVDAIAVESPPYFHPKQAAAGVAAGKHVYVAKPIAVDVPGCKSIEQSGKTASANKQVFLIDFQTRANEFFMEALKKVHDGAIGDFAFGESSYHAGSPWKGKQQFLDSDPNNAENRLRGWGMDIALSGDIITEQNIHTLDVMNWIMNEPPVYAVGTCGHKVRTDKGDCADHFTLVYQYSNGVGVTFSSRQFEGYDSPGGIKNRMFGSKGVLETEYGGNVMIRGEDYYRGGRTNAIYKEGAVTNIATFYDSIKKGDFSNPTVQPSVRSNLVTVLGRTAAYSGEQVFWYQLMQNSEKLVPNLKGLKE